MFKHSFSHNHHSSRVSPPLRERRSTIGCISSRGLLPNFHERTLRDCFCISAVRTRSFFLTMNSPTASFEKNFETHRLLEEGKAFRTTNLFFLREIGRPKRAFNSKKMRANRRDYNYIFSRGFLKRRASMSRRRRGASLTGKHGKADRGKTKYRNDKKQPRGKI